MTQFSRTLFDEATLKHERLNSLLTLRKVRDSVADQPEDGDGTTERKFIPNHKMILCTCFDLHRLS
jgi:hypothetical protein